MPQIINGTWADATPGQWILNEREMALYEIVQVKAGWLQVRRPYGLLLGDHVGEPLNLKPQRPDLPVILVVPTPVEAERLVRSELGGQVLEG